MPTEWRPQSASVLRQAPRLKLTSWLSDVENRAPATSDRRSRAPQTKAVLLGSFLSLVVHRAAFPKMHLCLLIITILPLVTGTVVLSVSDHFRVQTNNPLVNSRCCLDLPSKSTNGRLLIILLNKNGEFFLHITTCIFITFFFNINLYNNRMQITIMFLHSPFMKTKN